MARTPRQLRPHVVVAVVPAEPSLLELAAAIEVFGPYPPDVDGPWYELRVCTSKSPWKRSNRFGLPVAAPDGLEALADADTVIAMPWGGEVGNEAPADVIAALRAAYDRGARMLSFCTGAFLLAAAGVLDGRRVTTHWHAARDLAEAFPSVSVDPDVLYVDDGQVLTSAGSAASFDLALHVVRLDHGAEVANELARHLVVPPHRDGGQAQFVAAPVARAPGPDPFHETLDWAVDHLDEPLSVANLAARSLMSPRSFARKFRQVTGTSPHHWLLHQRVMLAQRLLETTDDSVERIAQAAGFGSAATLRMHFQRFVHTTPLAYRRTFCGDTAAAVGE
jgi:transcriptional regulator GlxA family with amidase domain